jgi:hypothetical protein
VSIAGVLILCLPGLFWSHATVKKNIKKRKTILFMIIFPINVRNFPEKQFSDLSPFYRRRIIIVKLQEGNLYVFSDL